MKVSTKKKVAINMNLELEKHEVGLFKEIISQVEYYNLTNKADELRITLLKAIEDYEQQEVK